VSVADATVNGAAEAVWIIQPSAPRPAKTRGPGLRPGATGLEREAFLSRFGAPMTPRQFGDHLVVVLDVSQYVTGLAFGLTGDTGITVLENEAA
jgi:hypothetical protein